jgi:mannose-6-phosphate isomerase-like protein (cupin superfamily)
VSEKRRFHSVQLPSTGSHLLVGSHIQPDDQLGWWSESLQILYNNADVGWTDPEPHAHRDSDEIFVVLLGSLIIEVEGEKVTVGPREFCCFPRGVFH